MRMSEKRSKKKRTGVVESPLSDERSDGLASRSDEGLGGGDDAIQLDLEIAESADLEHGDNLGLWVGVLHGSLQRREAVRFQERKIVGTCL